MADIKFKLEVEQGNFVSGIEKAIEEIHSLGREMGATQSEIQKAYKKLGEQAFGADGSKAIEYFQSQVKGCAKEVEELEAEVEKIGTKGGFAKGSDEAKALQEDLKAAKKDLDNVKAAYDGALGAQANLNNETVKTSSSIKALQDMFNALPSPISGALTSLKKLIVAAKAFIATPLGMVVGALAAAFGMLKSFFTSSADGQAKMAKSSAYLGSILSSLKDVAIAIGRALSNAFDNPIESLKRLKDAIVKNLQTRLEGVVQQAKSVGKMLKSLFSADWDGLKEGAKEYADSMAKIGTGKSLEDLKDGLNAAKESMSAFAKKAKETADAMAALATREYNLRQQRSKWQIKEAGLEEEIAKARLAAYDEESSAADRADALAKAQELITQKYQQQIAFAQEEYDITKKRNSLHESTIEDLEKEDELNANITRLQAQMTSELAGIERRRATAAKQAKAEEYRMAQEQLSLEIQVGEKRLEMQDESLEKTMEQIRLTKQKQQIELQNQEHEWREKQKGELTDAQEAYIKSMSGLIEEAAVAAGEQAIFEKYADAAQKAFKQNQISEGEIQMLKDQGRTREAAEAERQRNEQALAYMQDVEGGLTPEFKMWIDSLGDYTTKTLESMLASAEEQLTVLKAAGAPQEQIIAAEARIAALYKEVKQAQTDIQRGPKLTAYKNLNKVLGDAASGFEALGQTGNEAFDSLMKNVADITNTVQTVVANIQTLVQSSIEGMKEGAEAGANAVKTVEKASVILAIIGAVITLTMKLAQLVDDSNLSHMPEIRKDVENLRKSLRDLKREMALDVSDNDTIFGDNQLKNLQQYTKAFNDYVQTYTEGVDKMAMSGYDEERKRQLATAIGNDTKDFMNRQFDRALADVKKEGYSLADAVNQMLDTTQIKTRDGGLFRSAKYESLRSVLGEDANKIIGATEKETIKNLKTLIDTQSQLKDEQKATIEDMIRDWETYNEALEGVKGYFNDFFGEMTDSFAESIKVGLTDGVKEGKQNFKEAVLDMVTDMYISKTIGEQFSKALEDAGKQVESIQTNESLSPEEKLKQQTDVIADTANTLVDGFDQSLSVVEAVRDRVRDKIGMGAGELDGTLSGAIKGASQESIDLLSGYCNAVRIQQVDGINIMREQLISLSGIEGNTRAINVGLQGFRTSMENILRTDGSRAVGAVA